LLVRWYGQVTPSRSRSSTLELCHREYVRERKIKVESRRQRPKTDSRPRDDAGDPVARPRDELAAVNLLVKLFNPDFRFLSELPI
jgi:hypothetical protein